VLAGCCASSDLSVLRRSCCCISGLFINSWSRSILVRLKGPAPLLRLSRAFQCWTVGDHEDSVFPIGKCLRKGAFRNSRPICLFAFGGSLRAAMCSSLSAIAISWLRLSSRGALIICLTCGCLECSVELCSDSQESVWGSLQCSCSILALHFIRADRLKSPCLAGRNVLPDQAADYPALDVAHGVPPPRAAPSLLRRVVRTASLQFAFVCCNLPRSCADMVSCSRF